VRRATVLLAAAAAVVSWSLAAPVLACDGHKGETTAAAAKAEEARPAVAAVEAKGGCAKAATAEAAVATADVKAAGAAEPAVVTAEGKGGCAKAKAKGGCAKATATTVAKNDEAKGDEAK